MINKEGPFTGLKNGDRKYMIDFSGGKNLGTYHLIDGTKVHISYHGQRRTCARCQRTAATCPGDGIARKCEDNGGLVVFLKDHMKTLWDEIGFKPADFTMEKENDEVNDKVEIRENEGFTPAHKGRPKMSEVNKKKLCGVSVRNLPADIAPDQAQTFLETLGLPVDHTDITTTKMKYSTTLNVEGLSPEICCTIMENVEGTIAFDKKIYCKGIIGDLESKEPENCAELEVKELIIDGESPREYPKGPPTSQGTPAGQGTQAGQGSPGSQHPTIPGLSLSKSEEKKLKQKKKNGDEKEEDDFTWSSLKTHPVFNAQKGANGTSKVDTEKKRNASKANLSPQDKNLLARSKNLKTK